MTLRSLGWDSGKRWLFHPGKSWDSNGNLLASGLEGAQVTLEDECFFLLVEVL